LLFTARLISQASRLGYVVLIVRALGPDRYGILAYVHAWGIMFLPIANMGSQALLSRSFGHSIEEGRILAQRLWTLRLLVMPILFFLLIVITVGSEPDPGIKPLFLIVGLALMGRGFSLWCNHVLIANRRADRVLKIEALFRIGELTVAAVALHHGTGIAGLLFIHAFVWWLQAIFSSLWVGFTVVRPAWRWHDLQGISLLKQGLTVMVSGLTLFVLLQGPLVIGRHLLGSNEELGYFALAMQVLQVLITVPNVIGIAALPVLTVAGASETGQRYLRLVVPASIVVALLLAGISAIWGEQILNLLFGAHFIAAAPFLTLGLLVLLVPLAPAALLSHAALASRQPDTLRNVALSAFGGLLMGVLVTGVLCIFRQDAEALLIGAGGGASAWLLLLIGLHRHQRRNRS